MFGQALAEGFVAGYDVEASDADFGWGIDEDALSLDAVLDRFWSIGVDFKAVESAVGAIVMEPGRQRETEVCRSGCELEGSSFRVDRILKIVGDKKRGVFGGDRREVPRGFAVLEDSFVAVGGTRLEDRSEQIDFATYSADWIEQVGEFRKGLHAEVEPIEGHDPVTQALPSLGAELLGGRGSTARAQDPAPSVVGTLGPVSDADRSALFSEASGHGSDGFQGSAPSDRLAVPAVVFGPGIGCGCDDAVGIVVRVIGQSGVVSPSPFFAERDACREPPGRIRSEFIEDFLGRDRSSSAVLWLA